MNNCEICIFKEDSIIYQFYLEERLIKKVDVYKCTKELTDKEFLIAIQDLSDNKNCPYFKSCSTIYEFKGGNHVNK